MTKAPRLKIFGMPKVKFSLKSRALPKFNQLFLGLSSTFPENFIGIHSLQNKNTMVLR